MKELDKQRKNIVTERFRDAVVKWMADHHSNQSDLAKRAGVTRAIVANVISGHRTPTLTSAVLLSRAMGVSLDEIESGRIADVADPSQFAKLFKEDFLKTLKSTVKNGQYYSRELVELTDDQKDTIIRLIYAYLDVSKTGHFKGDDKQ
ncbi:helix-turn-helix domain-containing protein [Limosilactobacillus reuteri]|uniref:Helix-turn-helix domain-containing protein n=1 Tax=Limosilactobacillus reuteri TaxID=1598 RepID=A0AAW4X4L1_LIMRT|nr:helix-turn-helix transcriptional regulator [Limosilactobacillus reuteri]MCC4477344.1 helix-turn-helix domain-containing protein [Limosilactobacillus reuteri]MCC4479620.1 helix-turn-helix domain-containing protein [Limosilactobacillus reuteri]MCC4489074.1 helix-turn-helix domain-containing protein [Limosilactobacillus reuteri]MCC4493227.1 helix-turn-helix domain-containing protein [Limosilactobacillus reuteri]MCC4496101.1 helix-turn-helix domain-containing protein [Limosilactobacillus reuter